MPRASWRGFLRLSLCPARSICRRRRHARNPFACTRCGNQRRSIWTRMLCPIRVKGSRVLRHRHRGSSPTMPALMETRAPPPPGSRFGRMIPQLARRSIVESSKVIDLEKFVPRNDNRGVDPARIEVVQNCLKIGTFEIGCAFRGRGRSAVGTVRAMPPYDGQPAHP